VEVPCTFSVEAALSPAISTVGIVTWSTTLSSLTSAQIRFGLPSTGPTMTAPVDLTQPGYRTLLLGMKASQTYLFRIVATGSDGTCTSPNYAMVTGPMAANVPTPVVTNMNPAAHARGFIVTSSGIAGNWSYILDADGDPVWWSTGPQASSRAAMSWDGQDLYVMALNVQNAGGEVWRMSMDGMTSEKLAGLETAHHDLTAIPGGIATLLWNTPGLDAHCSLVERSASGELTTVIADLNDVYNSNTFHANAVHYYPQDDSYTISDRNPNLFVKVTRRGQLVWQFGGTNPKDQSKFFSGAAWQVNHGHQLLPSGNFLFFNNGSIATGVAGLSNAREYQLDMATMKATLVWSYAADKINSMVLGDVQRLPNGNNLVTFSSMGAIHEVAPNGQLVMSLKASQFGYATWRETLYGPPPR